MLRCAAIGITYNGRGSDTFARSRRMADLTLEVVAQRLAEL